MAGADYRRYSTDRPVWFREWPIGILQGFLSALGQSFVLPVIVLTVYVSLFTDNLVTVGAALAIVNGGWALGALIARPLIARRGRYAPWAFAATAIQSAALALIAYTAFQETTSSSDRLRALFVALAAFSVSGGIASFPTAGVLSKSVGVRQRSSLFALRGLFAAAAAIGAGLIIRQVFGPSGPDRTEAFGYQFMAGAAALGAAAFFVFIFREAGRTQLRTASGPGGVSKAPLHDAAFRRHIGFRSLLAISGLADGFLALYVIQRLELSLTALGTFVAAIGAGVLAGLLLWPRVAQRRGSRPVLQSAAVLRLPLALVALAIPLTLSAATYQERFSDHPWLYWLAIAGFGFWGAGLAAQIVGGFLHLMTLTPPNREAEYTDTANFLLALTTLAPMAGGWIAGSVSYRALFATAIALGLITIFGSGLLKPSVAESAIAAKPRRLRSVRI